ncbi:ubiquitin-like protein 4A [Chiloscyllium punctatum]|uniref:ubiquitin-like protein 4A n=1 Tax=Chiloscyllium punctatum TaxID=137246 RepID=UPI003B633295
MQLTIKQLHGSECRVEPPSLSSLATHPPPTPNITDDHRLSDYSIRANTKLNLVVKPSDRSSPDGTAQTARPQPWQLVWEILAKHFTPADAEKVLEQLQKDYERALRLLSLDDIERISTRILHPDSAESLELSFLD